jgi:hypothetical protein
MESLVMSSQSEASCVRLRNVYARAAAMKRASKTRSKKVNVGSSVSGSLAGTGVSWQPNHSVTRRTARIAR